MAYISDNERNKRIKASNQSYGLRKAFIAVTVTLLVLLVAGAVVALVLTYINIPADAAEMSLLDIVTKYLNGKWWSLLMIDTNGNVSVAPIAVIILGIAVLTIGFAIATLVLVVTIKSPRSVKANIKVLQSSAIPGKKLDAKDNAPKVFDERAAMPKKDDKKVDKKAKDVKKVDKKGKKK